MSPEVREEIRKAFNEAVRKQLPPDTLECEVKSVDSGAATIVALSRKEDLEYPNVRLLANVGDTLAGIIALPKVGSKVFVGFTDGMDTEAFVVQYSEIDSFKVVIGNISLLINSEKIQLNGEDLGGIVKARVLEQELNKTNQLIQALLTVIQGVSIPEAGNGAPSAFQAALLGALTGQQLGDYSQLENSKVTHG